jgi:hypothetical protein
MIGQANTGSNSRSKSRRLYVFNFLVTGIALFNLASFRGFLNYNNRDSMRDPSQSMIRRMAETAASSSASLFNATPPPRQQHYQNSERHRHRPLVNCLAATQRVILSSSAKKKNVVFILAVDLRPQLSHPYPTKAHTPNLAAFGRDSTTFKYAFNQAPICAPSRASLLSGRRPDVTRQYGFELIGPPRSSTPKKKGLSKWRDIAGFFKSHDYSTHNVGKIYHYNSEQRNKYEWDSGWPGDNHVWNVECRKEL